jgi:MerR family transcriptional regulator, thiopeptide resistance regulator
MSRLAFNEPKGTTFLFVLTTLQRITKKMYTIGKLAEKFGLSRSALLYYDKIGLLKPSSRAQGRTGEGQYRRYSAKEAERLRQICQFRQVGLSLQEIQQVLDSPHSKLARILENRLEDLNRDIQRLRDQQRVIVGLLKNPQAHKRIGIMNKETWSSLLAASGFSDEDMRQWHIDFERQSPEQHQQFLEFLCIPQEEIRQIRTWEKSELSSDRSLVTR